MSIYLGYTPPHNPTKYMLAASQKQSNNDQTTNSNAKALSLLISTATLLLCAEMGPAYAVNNVIEFEFSFQGSSDEGVNYDDFKDSYNALIYYYKTDYIPTYGIMPTFTVVNNGDIDVNCDYLIDANYQGYNFNLIFKPNNNNGSVKLKNIKKFNPDTINNLVNLTIEQGEVDISEIKNINFTGSLIVAEDAKLTVSDFSFTLNNRADEFSILSCISLSNSNIEVKDSMSINMINKTEFPGTESSISDTIFIGDGTLTFDENTITNVIKNGNTFNTKKVVLNSSDSNAVDTLLVNNTIGQDVQELELNFLNSTVSFDGTNSIDAETRLLSYSAKTITFNDGAALNFTIDHDNNGFVNGRVKLQQRDRGNIDISKLAVKATITLAAGTALVAEAKPQTLTIFTGDTVEGEYDTPPIVEEASSTAGVSTYSNAVYTIKQDPTNAANVIVSTEEIDAAIDAGEDPDNPSTDPEHGGGGDSGDSSDPVIPDPDPQPEPQPEEYLHNQFAEQAKRLGASSSEADVYGAWMAGSYALGSVQEQLAEDIHTQMQRAPHSALNALSTLAPASATFVSANEVAVRDFLGTVTDEALDGSPALKRADLVPGTAMWVKASYGDGATSGLNRLDYDISRTHLALGFDHDFGPTTVGLGYAYTDSSVDALNRSVDGATHSLFAYGKYRLGQAFVKALGAFSMSDYEEDKQVLSHQVTADYDVDTWTLGVKGGYDFALGTTTITPEFGLSYLSIDSDDYTDSLGQAVTADRASVTTLTAGLKFQHNLATALNYALQVRAGLEFSYDLDADGIDYAVDLGNGQSYDVVGEDLERFAFSPSLGLKVVHSSGLEFDFSGGGSWRDNYHEAKFSAGLNYSF